jgi:hypothetical protein
MDHLSHGARWERSLAKRRVRGENPLSCAAPPRRCERMISSLIFFLCDLCVLCESHPVQLAWKAQVTKNVSHSDTAHTAISAVHSFRAKQLTAEHTENAEI